MGKVDEIAYFERISDSGRDYIRGKPFGGEGDNLLIGIGQVLSLMPSPPARVLDAGCGIGWTSRFFSRQGYDVKGIDISGDVIKEAKKIARKEKVEVDFVVSDFEKKFDFGEFDCVVFFDSFHHSETFKLTLENVFSCLKKGGICILSEPGNGHSKQAHTLEMKKYGVTDRDVVPLKIKKLAREVGFREFRVYPPLRSLNFLARGNFLDSLKSVFYILFYKNFEGVIVLRK